MTNFKSQSRRSCYLLEAVDTSSLFQQLIHFPRVSKPPRLQYYGVSSASKQPISYLKFLTTEATLHKCAYKYIYVNFLCV